MNKTLHERITDAMNNKAVDAVLAKGDFRQGPCTPEHQLDWIVGERAKNSAESMARLATEDCTMSVQIPKPKPWQKYPLDLLTQAHRVPYITPPNGNV